MAAEHVTLDEMRDALFSAQRALERHAGEVKKIADVLNDRKPEDEWLELSQETLHKAELFLSQQLEVISRQKERLDKYINGVRELAESEALKGMRMVNRMANGHARVHTFSCHAGRSKQHPCARCVPFTHTTSSMAYSSIVRMHADLSLAGSSEAPKVWCNMQRTRGLF